MSFALRHYSALRTYELDVSNTTSFALRHYSALRTYELDVRKAARITLFAQKCDDIFVPRELIATKTFASVTCLQH